VEDVNDVSMAQLRAVVSVFGKAVGKTVLFKNTVNSVRVGPLSKVFPEALFIVLSRDELAVGRSLLTARKQLAGSYDRWWFTEVPGMESIVQRPCYEQVILQQRAIYAHIAEIRAALPPERFFDVSYEEFCESPSAAVGQIIDFLSEGGATVDVAHEPASRFTPSAGPPLPSQLEQSMVAFAKGTPA